MTRYAVLSLLCLACGPELLEPDGMVYVSPELHDQAWEDVIGAAQAWNDSGLTRLSVTRGTPRDVYDFRGAYVMPSFGDPGWFGETLMREGTGPLVWLNVSYVRDDWTRTAMHEIGHALGLDHAQSGLMRARDGSEPCIDEVTLAAALRTFESVNAPKVTCTGAHLSEPRTQDTETTLSEASSLD